MDLSHEVYQLKRLLERAEQNIIISLVQFVTMACFLEAYKLVFQVVYILINEYNVL